MVPGPRPIAWEPEARPLKEPESENVKLKTLLAEQLLAIEGLKELAGKKMVPRQQRGKRLIKQPAKDQVLGAQPIEASGRYPRVAIDASP